MNWSVVCHRSRRPLLYLRMRSTYVTPPSYNADVSDWCASLTGELLHCTASYCMSRSPIRNSICSCPDSAKENGNQVCFKFERTLWPFHYSISRVHSVCCVRGGKEKKIEWERGAWNVETNKKSDKFPASCCVRPNCDEIGHSVLVIYVKESDELRPLLVLYMKNLMIIGLSSPSYPLHFQKQWIEQVTLRV